MIALTGIGVGLPALIDVYNEQQKRIPKPLAAQGGSDHAPAADAGPSEGRAAALPGELQQQLDEQYRRANEGITRDKARVQKLEEGRTAHNRVWRNADGTKSLEYSVSPTSYQEGGQWKDVDTGLAQDQATGQWRTKANSWQARFGAVSSTEGVELAQGSQTLAFKPVGSSRVEPIVTGEAPNQIVKYRNVWPGIDLVYQLSSTELKESIVVKSRTAANTFSFDVTGAALTPDPEFAGGYKLSGELSASIHR